MDVFVLGRSKPFQSKKVTLVVVLNCANFNFYYSWDVLISPSSLEKRNNMASNTIHRWICFTFVRETPVEGKLREELLKHCTQWLEALVKEDKWKQRHSSKQRIHCSPLTQTAAQVKNLDKTVESSSIRCPCQTTNYNDKKTARIEEKMFSRPHPILHTMVRWLRASFTSASSIEAKNPGSGHSLLFAFTADIITLIEGFSLLN